MDVWIKYLNVIRQYTMYDVARVTFERGPPVVPRLRSGDGLGESSNSAGSRGRTWAGLGDDTQ